MFATAIHLHLSLIFVGKAGAYQSGAIMGLHSNGRLLTLPTNIKLGWKRMAGAKTLAYYDVAKITDVKSFDEHAPGVVSLLHIR